MNRSRVRYILMTLLAAGLGIASRAHQADFLPSFITTYTGDTLWALALFFLLGVLFPRMRTVRLALLAFAVSVAVEISQLYQADWINAIRGTRVGGLILGYGFKWTDLACYAAGCLIGVFGEFFFQHRSTRIDTDYKK